MYWEDEPYFEDFDFQALSEEYLDKVKELFNTKFKDYIEGLKLERESFKEKENNLRKRAEELNEKENDLIKRENYLTAHKNDLIQEMLTRFGLDLKPFQKVFVIANNEERHECPCCKGKGVLSKIIDEVEYRASCKRCNGRGYYYTNHYQIVSGEVGDMEICLDWDTKGEWIAEKLNGCFEKKSRFHIGNFKPCSAFYSDYRYFDRNEIFLTEEEAQKEIERRVLEESKDE